MTNVPSGADEPLSRHALMEIDGLVSLPSIDGFDATVGRLDTALVAHKIVPVLRLDHAAAAAAVGLKLDPIVLIVFGNPMVGTVLMQAAPTVGIDLPLKLLVWQSDDARVWISYIDPAWIGARHHIHQPTDASTAMASLLDGLALAASGTKPSNV